MALIFLILNPVFAAGISFTPQQCERFQAEGVSGGDYYINEALARDCGIKNSDDGYFMPLILDDQKPNCEMKNLALNDSNSGYLQDVVTFNNMHPDYFYPDRGDEYPFVFVFQSTQTESSAVSVDINTIDGCRNRVEALLGSNLNENNIILTTAHSLAVNKDTPNCRLMNEKEINQSILAAGPDVGKRPFVSKVGKVICAVQSCDQFEKDLNNDFCIIISKKILPHATNYKKLTSDKLNEKSFLVAYQPTLISSLKKRNIKNTERIISVNKDGHLLINDNDFIKSNDNFIIHHADLASGASGGGLFLNNKLFGLSVAQLITEKDRSVQRGLKYTPAVNYAIDPQVACQRLSYVLK